MQYPEGASGVVGVGNAKKTIEGVGIAKRKKFPRTRKLGELVHQKYDGRQLE